MYRKKDKSKQTQLQMLCIEELLPQDHMLREIENAIDWSFIYDEVKGLYKEAEWENPGVYHRVDYSGLCDNVFYVEIRDIDIEILGKYGLTYDTYFPEATELAKFIANVVAKDYTIICQCEYGQSRSAACAAAIKEFYEKSGIQIFANYKYYPNQLIFNKLLEALVRNKDNGDID